jgi:hypothetical protein
MTVAVATSNAEILYDSGRVPLWLRLPCLLLALLCLAIAIDLVALPVAGQTLLLPPPVELPLGWLPAVLGAVLLAAFLSQVWLGRKRILWEAGCGELLLEDRWLLGTSRRRIGRPALAAVQVRLKRLRASTFWDIYIRGRCGRVTWLTRAYAGADAQAVGGRIAAAIGRPLEVA